MDDCGENLSQPLFLAHHQLGDVLRRRPRRVQGGLGIRRGGVDTRRVDLSSVPGRFGWVGGIGTAGCSDPSENLAGILLTERMMESAVPPRVITDFWTLVYQAIEECGREGCLVTISASASLMPAHWRLLQWPSSQRPVVRVTRAMSFVRCGRGKR